MDGKSTFKKFITIHLSERGDSNARPLRPERSALPTALLSAVLRVQRYALSKEMPNILCFFPKLLGNTEKSSIFAPAFEKCYVGAIAQLVEQRTENPCVPGSIPGGTTKKIANS